MTRKDKIAWLLMAPFLIGIAAGFIFCGYMVLTEASWRVTAGLTGLFSAIVGFYLLTYDTEDIML